MQPVNDLHPEKVYVESGIFYEVKAMAWKWPKRKGRKRKDEAYPSFKSLTWEMNEFQAK